MEIYVQVMFPFVKDYSIYASATRDKTKAPTMSQLTANAKSGHWLSGERSELVTLPSGLRLQLSASGPPRRTPSEPVVVIVHGMGGSTAEWVACTRLIANFARVYMYSRAGYWPSDSPPNTPTPASSAEELRTLLQTTGIDPPYLLVGHSHGGVLIRQCFADWPLRWIGGMVIVDSAPKRNAIPASWSELLGDASYTDVVGLERERALTDEEWNLVQELDSRNAGVAALEAKDCDAHAAVLRSRLDALHEPLGDVPLSVVCCEEAEDMRKVYAYGLEHGHGSAKAREAMRKRLEDMAELDEAGMREHLKMSRNARFVKAQGKQRTHNVHMVDPGFVAGEVEWVFKGGQSAFNG